MKQSYPLASLLSVRLYRESAAKSALRAAEVLLQDALNNVQACKQTLEEYRLWWPEEQTRRYDAIMGAQMKRGELDAFKAGLAQLADGELVREQAVFEAEKALEAQKQRVAQARDAVAACRREAAKIETHRGIWLEAAKKESERLEDAEMEEFSGAGKHSDAE